MKYRAVLFDLDGTLLDTLQDLGEAMNSVLRGFDWPVHDLAAYQHFVGEGMENLVRRALPANERHHPDRVSQCLAAMREEYGRRWAENTRPYVAIPELLDGLTKRGVKMAVLSNKTDEFAKAMVARLLGNWKFECVFGERTGVPRKPDPAPALEIAALMGLAPREFLYLGDTSIDMRTAVSAGMYPVGVLWGFRDAEELLGAGAKSLIQSPVELFDLLRLKGL